MRVLVVDPRRSEGDLLREMVATLGHSVFHVTSALTALTLVERHSPEAWLVSLDVADLGLAELCAAVRWDPASARCLLLLYGEPEPGDELPELPEGADTFLRTDGDLVALTYLADREMRLWHERRVRERWSPDTHTLQALTSGSQGIEGRFGVISFAEIVQMIGLAGRRAVLSVDADGVAGALYFKRSAVVHAECGGAVGWAAVERLAQAIWADPSSSFRIERSDPRVLDGLPVTVGLHAQQVLLRLAVDRDHGTRDGGSENHDD